MLSLKQRNNIKALSMGQGQEEAARNMLAEGLAKGHWVMLQNCHLSGII